MRRIHGGLVRAVAAMAVLALLLTACGDDDETDGGSSPSPTDTSAPSPTATDDGTEPSGEAIVLMTILEQEGPGSNPEIVDGATAAVKGINARGGVDGRPLELIVCDTSSDPNQAAACGQQAVSEGVAAVVGSLSALSGSFMPILTENSIPAVGIVPAGQDEFISPMSFPLYGGLVTAAAGIPDALVLQGASAVSVARIDLPQAAAIPQFAGAGLARHQQQVVNDVAVPAGAADMAPYVASTLEGGTDGVMVGLFGQDAQNYIVELKNTDPDVLVGATTTDLGGVIDALGDLAEGLITVTSFVSVDAGSSAVQQYLDDLEAAGTEHTGSFSINAYASVLVFAEAAAGLDEVTGANVAAALAQMDSASTGLTPPLDFTQGGVAGLPRIFSSCLRYQHLEGGEFVGLTDGFVDVLTGEACPEP